MSAGQPHRHEVRVYWEDTDAGGIVYHASHVQFFERGRTELLRSIGFIQSRTADRTRHDALLFAVRRMEIDYLRPAQLDDLLIVETRLSAAEGPRIVLAQRLLRGEELVAAAMVTVVVIGANGRPRRIPAELAARFEMTR